MWSRSVLALVPALALLACNSKRDGQPSPSASTSATSAASAASADASVIDAAPADARASDAADPSAPVDAAATDPSASKCPGGMKYVSGDYCKVLRHKCVKGREGKANVSCPEGCYVDPRECQEWLPGSAECVPTKPVTKDGKSVLEPDYVHLEFCMDDAEWPNEPGQKPKVFISYFDSEKLCASVGKRVCTSAEYTLACEGPEHLPTGYGWKIDGNVCNVDKTWRDWNKVNLHTPEGFAKIDQSETVGSRPQCVSPYGIHDLTGNVDEWTKLDPADRGMSDHPSQLKGGYYAKGAHPFCRAHTDFHGPEFTFYQISTRCCAAPKGAGGGDAGASPSASASTAPSGKRP